LIAKNPKVSFSIRIIPEERALSVSAMRDVVWHFGHDNPR
jgi:hypothetical protein